MCAAPPIAIVWQQLKVFSYEDDDDDDNDTTAVPFVLLSDGTCGELNERPNRSAAYAMEWMFFDLRPIIAGRQLQCSVRGCRNSGAPSVRWCGHLINIFIAFEG